MMKNKIMNSVSKIQCGNDHLIFVKINADQVDILIECICQH